jgi:hypothetical protein
MLRCDSVAPLGNPVVPDVYWMLIGSSVVSVSSTWRSASASPDCPAAITSSQEDSPMRTTSTRSGESPRTSSIMSAYEEPLNSGTATIVRSPDCFST